MNNELLKKIYVGIAQDKQLLELIPTDCDPNVFIKFALQDGTLMHTVCRWPGEFDIKLAKQWLSFEFAIPIDLDIKCGANTCIHELMSTNSSLDFKMLKVILDSKPGQKLLLREASTLQTSPLMDELCLSKCGENLDFIRLLGIIICHVNVEAITDEH